MIDIAAGGAHSAAITANGELYSWGKGRYGRLGHADSEDQSRPKLVRIHDFFHCKTSCLERKTVCVMGVEGLVLVWAVP